MIVSFEGVWVNFRQQYRQTSLEKKRFGKHDDRRGEKIEIIMVFLFYGPVKMYAFMRSFRYYFFYFNLQLENIKHFVQMLILESTVKNVNY